MGVGRKPKPTKLKILQGNPGKRKINKNEIDPEPNIPDFPTGLPAEAKKEWLRISKELFSLGLLTAIDKASLVAYCVIWARWIDAERRIKKQGVILKKKSKKDKSVYEYQNPYLSVANKALAQMKLYLTEFGMSPSSRARVSSSGEKKESNPFDEI